MPDQVFGEVGFEQPLGNFSESASIPSESVEATSPSVCQTSSLNNESVQIWIDDATVLADPNLPFGDEMVHHKSSDTLRVYFQNANSIRSKRMEKWLHTCVCMRAKEVDIFGLAEINVNPRHPGLTEAWVQLHLAI